MSEFDDFARLRPKVDQLDEITRASLRAGLFPQLAEVAPAEVDGVTTDPPTERRRVHRRSARRSRALAALTAVALLAAGIIGARAATGPSDTTVQAGAGDPAQSTSPATSEGTVSLSPTPVPFLSITDSPGWSLSYASIQNDAGSELVLARPDQGIDGPLARIGRSTESTSVYGDTVTEVTVNGRRGLLSGIGEIGYLSWETPDGQQLKVRAHQLDDSTLLDLAAAIDVDEAGGLTLNRPVAGLAPVDDASAAAMATYASYLFSNADGRTLQVSIYPGGSFSQDGPVSTEDRQVVSFQGEDAYLLDYGQGSGRYRVNFVQGFWAWEFDGEPFADHQALLDVIARLTPVDQETWNESLPPGLVTPEQRPTEVAEMLAGLPLPSQFDVDSLADRPVTDRREALAAEVAEAVSCAWLQAWIAADSNGDRPSARAAAEAIRSVGQSELVQQAGPYTDGVPQISATLSATLLGLTEGTTSPSPDNSTEKLSQNWPCTSTS